MIEIIKDLPPHISGFRATGKVTKNDYETVLMPEVDRLAKSYGKINFLLFLDTEVGNYTAGAWLDDALLGLKHITKWHRMAIVSNQDAVKKITDVLGHLIPGKSKGFKISELEDAKKWVAES